jgi:uncharacterized protein YecE (DUF72 family)
MPPAAGASILVGVAGWSYPDWRGVFYPIRGKGGELARVARLFDCVEINVTFYRPPERRMAEGWLRSVEDRPAFLFTTKVPKELTHEKGMDAAAIRSGAAAVVDGLRPLIDAGRLGAVLLQFPFYFRDSPESRDRIRILAESFHPLPVTVELRSLGFFFGTMKPGAPPSRDLETGPGSALAFLEEIGAGIVNIDLPPGPNMVPPTAIRTSPVGYVRLHGRNSTTWFDPKAGRDAKYDYLYSVAEIAEWKDRVLRLGERTARTFVIANNHFRGQAPANAIELLHLLGRTPADIPRELLFAYPEIQRLIERGAAEPPADGAPPGEGGGR